MSSWEHKSVEERDDALNGIFEKLEGAATAENPDWPGGLALFLLADAIKTLRDRIEDPAEELISWENPLVELQYEADWNWQQWEKSGESHLFNGGWTHEEIKTMDGAISALENTLAKTIYSATFLALTEGVGLARRGNRETWLLPPELREELDALEESERLEELGRLRRPFWIGAREGEGGIVLVGEEAKALDPDFNPLEVELTLQADNQGEADQLGGQSLTVRASIVAAFHPLRVDEDERKAFWPVVVGLVLHPLPATEEGASPRLPKPEEWPEECRRVFWDDVLKALEEESAPFWESIDLEEDLLSAPKPARITAPEVGENFPVAFGPVLVDRQLYSFTQNLHSIHFPARKWSNLLPWDELLERERNRILEEDGEDAFEDLRERTGDKEARGPLLKRSFKRDGTTGTISLTAEAERALKLREGYRKGFRFVDKYGREYLNRLFKSGSGFVEVGLSWGGIAGPWVEEWRKDLKASTEAAAAKSNQLPMFEELQKKEQAAIERRMAGLHMLEDSHLLMRAVLGRVYQERSTKIEYPARALRVLLKLDKDPNWKGRLENTLEALRNCSFRMDSYGTGDKVAAYGNFIGEWRYAGAGKGGHGEGTYTLFVMPGFVGALSLYEKDAEKLPGSGLKVLHFDFGKKPTREEKEAAREKAEGSLFVQFDAGLPFYDSAQGLTPEQQKLHAFIEREITPKFATVSKFLGDYGNRKQRQLPKRDKSAKEPRQYTREDCPLLRAGERYQAALGAFTKNPESGRTLYGTRQRATKTGGARTQGLLAEMGYFLPTGGAHMDRQQIVEAALKDLKAVVVEYLGGVAAARHGGNWLSLEEAARLNLKELGKEAKWFLFVPGNWQTEVRPRKFKEATGYSVTTDRLEAARAQLQRTGHAIPPPKAAVQEKTRGDVGLESLDLHLRLQAARNGRKLTARQAAALFGVNQALYSRWEKGTRADEDGKVRGKPIPADLAPLMLRWIESGEPPTVEALAARKARRNGSTAKAV